jgi:D-glycero-D-manno-heptose 1,7-bisphosphate phosphatase
MRKKAVFLDRDGTLMKEKEYLYRPEEVEVLPGVPGALRRLEEADYLLVLVTNQSGVGREYFQMEDVHRVHARLLSELAAARVRISKIYVAPEAPGQPSRGRKPSPQFLFDARDELEVELAESFMVGDKLIDLQCGCRAGVKRSLLVRTGYGAIVEREEAAAVAACRAVVLDDLVAAADWILGRGQRPGSVVPS